MAHCRPPLGDHGAMSVMPKRLIAPVGQRFGRLLVEAGVAGSCPSLWICICDCGVRKSIRSNSIRTGAQRSCGCLRRESLRKAGLRHGGSHTSIYVVWQLMNKRCSNPKDGAWDRYGGRGIRVCERWATSFENFRADMGERPAGTSIDRIDNDGFYEPGNCRWATRREQQNNRRNTVRIEYRGETKSLTEWCRQFGTNLSTARKRIRLGWAKSDVFRLPPQSIPENF